MHSQPEDLSDQKILSGSVTAEAFAEHVAACAECRESLFSLCAVGKGLLDAAIQSTPSSVLDPE
jgi:hypothetical protein